jgi:hypothetical protein
MAAVEAADSAEMEAGRAAAEAQLALSRAGRSRFCGVVDVIERTARAEAAAARPASPRKESRQAASRLARIVHSVWTGGASFTIDNRLDQAVTAWVCASNNAMVVHDVDVGVGVSATGGDLRLRAKRGFARPEPMQAITVTPGLSAPILFQPGTSFAFVTIVQPGADGVHRYIKRNQIVQPCDVVTVQRRHLTGTLELVLAAAATDSVSTSSASASARAPARALRALRKLPADPAGGEDERSPPPPPRPPRTPPQDQLLNQFWERAQQAGGRLAEEYCDRLMPDDLLQPASPASPASPAD